MAAFLLGPMDRITTSSSCVRRWYSPDLTRISSSKHWKPSSKKTPRSLLAEMAPSFRSCNSPAPSIATYCRQYSGSLITARRAMEFGTRSLRRAGKRHAAGECCAKLAHQAGRPACDLRRGRDRRTADAHPCRTDAGRKTGSRNLLAAASLSGSEKKLYELLTADEPVHIDDMVERSGLNSSEVLATLFDREMKGVVRQLPGKQFNKVLL